jgi:hypothetical protein
MNVSRVASASIVGALLVFSIAVAFKNAAALQRGPPDGTDGVEVLTRGPVHEAFAETVTFDPEAGLKAPKVPPAAIEELPPDQRPEGANVAWIPGYWAWDDERTDFLWISGIWRALPPGRQWVPGYWGDSGQNAQWTSGYWADAQASEVEYLPEPPASVEAGPNVEAPSADHDWLPGSWLWQQNRYAWRPGYWAAGQSDWNWVPVHYVWTSRGYVFVDGYYDYSVARRGVVFAPVYFRSGVYSQPGFSYSPTIAINPAVFGTHLFLRPAYGHYYYGDYYSSNYTTAGYASWQSFHSSRRGYDPFYAHQRWHHRNDRDWDRRVTADFSHRRDHEEARPSRTWTAQRDRSTSAGANRDKSFVVAASLEDLAKSEEAPIRFRPVPKQERQQISQRAQDVHKSRDERQKLEAQASALATGEPGRSAKPVRLKLPQTSLVAQPVDRLGKADAPPKAIAAPGADSNIEPKPRSIRGKADSTTERIVTKREPLPEQPNAASKAAVAEPRSERPKTEPRAEPRRAEPKVPQVEPRAERPKAEPNAPQSEPKSERPNVGAKAPTPERPMARPNAEPKASKTEARPERPKIAPKQQPQRETKAAPKRGAEDRPQGGAKGAPKGDAKNKPSERGVSP